MCGEGGERRCGDGGSEGDARANQPRARKVDAHVNPLRARQVDAGTSSVRGKLTPERNSTRIERAN